MIQRPTMDRTLLDVAEVMSKRGTCSRLFVGAVIAVNGRICSSGFNGAPYGMPHCDHPVAEDLLTVATCTTSVHAEANAVAFAARHGVPINGATLYCTHTPCVHCAMLLVNAGIVRVVCKMWYRDSTGVKILQSAGVQIWTMQRDGSLGVPVES